MRQNDKVWLNIFVKMYLQFPFCVIFTVNLEGQTAYVENCASERKKRRKGIL